MRQRCAVQECTTGNIIHGLTSGQLAMFSSQINSQVPCRVPTTEYRHCRQTGTTDYRPITLPTADFAVSYTLAFLATQFLTLLGTRFHSVVLHWIRRQLILFYLFTQITTLTKCVKRAQGLPLPPLTLDWSL